MSATTYAIFDVCRAMASVHNGVLYFSGPKIAAKFLSMGRNTPYKAAQFLVKHGWFKLIRKSSRRADGTLAPTVYKVLTHSEWTIEHPDACSNPLDDWQTTLSPSHLKCMEPIESSHPGEDSHILDTDSHTMDTDNPTLSEQTDKKQPIKTTHKNTDACSVPLSQNGMASPSAWSGVNAEAISTGARPLPQNGMAESDTPDIDFQVELECLVADVLRTLRLEGYQPQPSWTLALMRLRNKGYSAERILAVARHYLETRGETTVRVQSYRGLEAGFERMLAELNAKSTVDVEGRAA